MLGVKRRVGHTSEIKFRKSGAKDYAAGDAGRGAAARGDGVNDDGSAAIAEDGVVIVPHGDVGSDGGDVGGAILTHNEIEIGDVTGHGAVHVFTTHGIEMRAGAREIRGIAGRMLVNVDGVLARG